METNYAEEFGVYLRNLREQVYGESLRTFAKRAKLSAGYIGKLELGQVSVPKRTTIVTLAANLGFPPDALLVKAGYSPTEPALDEDIQFLALKLNRLPPELREAVLVAVSAVVDAFLTKNKAPRRKEAVTDTKILAKIPPQVQYAAAK